jgi:hypothetical protein
VSAKSKYRLAHTTFMKPPSHHHISLKTSASHLLIGRAATFYIAIAVGVTSASISYAQTAPPQGVATEPSLAYTVQPKDKLIVLSSTLLNGLQAWAGVAQYNGLKNPNLIYPGQKLNIPLRYLAAKPSGGSVFSASGDVSQGGQPVVLGSAIKEGGQFKTGANSSAIIELGDGSRIKLLPNTLAEVVSNRYYALRDASSSGSTNWFSGLMRLSSGALEALAAKNVFRASPLRIETPTSTVGVRGTEFRVAFDDPQTLSARTEVLEGLVRADNPAQAAGADLPMGTGAVVKPQDKDIKVVNLLPAPDLTGLSSEVFQPLASLNLPTLAGAASYRVVIAQDAQFNNIVRELKVPSGAPASLAGLETGNFYVLVRGIDAIGLEGFNSSKRIAIEDAPVTDPWRATSDKLISLNVVEGKTLVTWNDSAGDQTVGMRYAALVGTDASLANAAISSQTTQRSLDLGPLPPGTYFIRLRFTPMSGKVQQSALYRFTLTDDWNQTVFHMQSALQSIAP